jgi:hypothetical protein
MPRSKASRDKQNEWQKRYNKERAKTHPEIIALSQWKSSLKGRYDTTVDDYNDMCRYQHNRCAICGTIQPGSGLRHWHVDHSHLTNVIRGLLCDRCNLLLGYANDDPNVLFAAANYLMQFQHHNPIQKGKDNGR